MVRPDTVHRLVVASIAGAAGEGEGEGGWENILGDVEEVRRLRDDMRGYVEWGKGRGGGER